AQLAMSARSSSVILVMLPSGMYLLATTCLIWAACIRVSALVSSATPAGAAAMPANVGLAEWHSVQRATMMSCTLSMVMPDSASPAPDWADEAAVADAAAVAADEVCAAEVPAAEEDTAA